MIGALSAVTREPRSWTSGDVAFISTLATHAAIMRRGRFVRHETRGSVDASSYASEYRELVTLDV